MADTGNPETIILKPHWRAFGVWYLAMLLLGTGPLSNPDAILSPLQAFALAMIIGLGIFIKSKTSVLTVTKESISRRGGLFDRRELALQTADLAKIKILAGLSSRALGVGCLMLESKNGGSDIKFWGVENPRQARDRILRLVGSAEE